MSSFGSFAESESKRLEQIRQQIKFPGSVSPSVDRARQRQNDSSNSDIELLRESYRKQGHPAPVEDVWSIYQPLPPVDACIPIPLTGSTKQSYENAFVHDRLFLEDFIADAIPSKEMIDRARQLYLLLCDLTLHPDLISKDPLTQQNVDASEIVQWATRMSSKFYFLERLFRGEWY